MGKLNYLLKPKTVAVIGASGNSKKVGYSVMNNIITSGFLSVNPEHQLFPINPRSPEILGLKAYKSIIDVPASVDVAVIVVPARFVTGVAEQCATAGVKGVIIITAGFREVGGAGIELERQLVEISERSGMRIVGPNVLGIIAPSANMSFAAKEPARGPIAMLSQSGAMMTAVLDWADVHDVGFSYFISLGNKADVDEVDLIEEIAEDEDTKVIILYLESVNNGEKFLKILPKITAKKPVVILKSGTSAAGSAAASSHTGALAGNDIAFDLAFEKTGVVRAHTMNELFDMASIFSKVSLPKGDNFAIVTNAGGPGIIATDAFENNDLPMTSIPEACKAELRKVLPGEASVKNPVDIVGDAPPKRYTDSIEILFEQPHEVCAGALVMVTPQAQTNPDGVADVVLAMRQKYPEKFIVSSFMGGTSMTSPAAKLQEAGVPCYEFPEPAIKAMREMCRYAEVVARPPLEEVETPKIEIDEKRIAAILAEARADGRNQLLSHETSEIFTLLGVWAPATKLATSADEAASMATEITFPVVMKIVSPEIIHKSDCGGVKLFIRSEEQAKEAYAAIIASCTAAYPEANIKGVEVQQMVDFKAFKKTSEVIIGMNRDPTWGPMLMVGQGGVYANFVKDVAFELAYKFTEADARRQLAKTNISAILEGVRGEPRSAIDQLIVVMTRLAQLVQTFPEITELDMNPLLIAEETTTHPCRGVAAVDIKITLSQ